MNRKWQSSVAFGLLLAMALVMSGCDIFGSPAAPTPGPVTPTAATTGTPGGVVTGTMTMSMTATPAMSMTTTPAMTATITTTNTANLKPLKIGVIQTVVQPALLAATQGIKDTFKDKGYVEGQNITFDVKDGAGDSVNLSAIAQAFADPSANYDAIIAVGSPATLAAKKAVGDNGNKIPLFFVAVADPYGPKIANSATDHQDNLTGVQDSPPVTDALKLITQVLPNVKNVGLLWNPDEPNSSYTTKIARNVAATLNFTIVEQAATKGVNLADAANALADKQVDAFFVSTTNYVVTGLPSIAQAGADHNPKIPLFGNDSLSATRGACVAYGLDYSDSGRKVGEMAYNVLTGKTQIKNMPIQLQTKTLLYVNTFYAQQQGVTIPDTILKQAAQVLNGPAPTPTPTK